MTPYHAPEKFGLTLLGDFNFGHEHEFDIVAVVRTDDGRLAYLDDQGCSCPIPFDGKGVDDLTFCTPTELQNELKAASERNAYVLHEDDIDQHDAAIVDLMKRVIA